MSDLVVPAIMLMTPLAGLAGRLITGLALPPVPVLLLTPLYAPVLVLDALPILPPSPELGVEARTLPSSSTPESLKTSTSPLSFVGAAGTLSVRSARSRIVLPSLYRWEGSYARS